ncbi:MAG: sugar transferase [Streptococcus sp.]
MSFGRDSSSNGETEYHDYHTPAQKCRLSFKPGITGLWQVSGRSEITDFDEVVKLDVAYMVGRTIWRDIQIPAQDLVKVTVLRKEGAWLGNCLLRPFPC